MVANAGLAQRWRFLGICATAGALAVPLHAVATPVSAAIAGLTGMLGLLAWRWSGLPQPVEQENQSGLMRSAQPVVWLALGTAVGLLLLGMIRMAIEPVLPSIGTRIAAAGALPVWRRFLIIYVAAVGEELLFRLLLLSVVAGLAARLLRRPDSRPTPPVAWFANLVSAFAFALIHLPSWSGACTPQYRIGRLGAAPEYGRRPRVRICLCHARNCGGHLDARRRGLRGPTARAAHVVDALPRARGRSPRRWLPDGGFPGPCLDSWGGAAELTDRLEFVTIQRSRLFVMYDQPEELDRVVEQFFRPKAQ